MRSLHIALPFHAELNLNSRHLLLLFAAITAACLLTTYVGLLHGSVARGVQWRADQQLADATRGAKPMALSLKPSVKQALADTGR